MRSADAMAGYLRVVVYVMAVAVTSPPAVLAEEFTHIEEDVTTSMPQTTAEYIDPCDVHLLRYGESAGDRKFFGIDDGNVALFVPSGLRYFTKEFSVIYISTNGLVSLGEPFYLISPARLPYEDNNLVAPLWSDLDLSLSNGSETNGVIYYQLYEQYTTSDDDDISALYDSVREDVRTSTSDVGFKPNLVIVITWKNVPRYPASVDSTETATFQLVLTEDYSSQRSYALFRYGCINIANGAMPNTQGYTSELQTITQPPPYMEFITSNLITEDLINIHGPSGKPGSLTYAVSVDNSELQTAQFQCLLWGALQSQEEVAIQLATIILPPCPCTYFQAWLDGRYVVVPSKPNCFVTIGLNFGTFARMCCYDTATAYSTLPYSFLTRSRTAEAGSLLRYHPVLFPSRYSTADKQARQWCLVDSDNSAVYFRYRPPDDCLRYIGPRLTWLWGDPHLVTTDEVQYSFQGVGEYWLIKNAYIQVQGRASPLYSSDDSLVGGSYWSAVAMTDTSAKRNTSGPLIADKITITMTANKTGFIISSTKTDIMTWFNNSTLSAQAKVTEDATFSKSDGGIEVQLSSGVTVSAKIVRGQMSLSISVPQEALTEFDMVGLLGKADGDPSNDFTLPDGSFLPANSTQAQIYHNFGELWRITPEQSLFDYSVVEGDAITFSSPPDGYEPLFTDASQLASVNETVLNSVCGDDSFCRTDLLITGDTDLAASTKTVNEANTETREELQKVIPVITGPSELVVRLNKSAPLQLESNTSDRTLTYKENFDMPDGADLNPTTGLFIWQPSDYVVNPFNMSFGATDEDGVEAIPLTVTVKLCNCTATHGTCSEDIFQAVPSFNFKVMLCTCTAAYTGPSCEEDRNYCTPGACIEGATCTDQPAEQQTDDSPGYSCTNCPSGYQQVDSAGGTTKCQDIDECSEDTDNCTHTCTNTEGGFVCSCDEGYRLTDFSLCQDIDECSEGLADCAQVCTNTDGSFSCSCFDGYTLEGEDCKANQTTMDKCRDLNCNVGCRVVDDVAVCYCDSGYQLDADNITCIDINECDTSNACDLTTSICQNTDGSYYCQCNAGYTSGADNRTCTECEPLHWGVNCAELCVRCSSLANCDKVDGCKVCVSGWTGPKCDTDIDECTNASICGENSACVNMPGAYSCECNEGYRAVRDACVEIDDCLEENGEPRLTNPCEHGTCIDGFKSFTCNCNEGYTGANCSENVDDCGDNECLNGATCIDGVNSYTCICAEGYYGDRCQSEVDDCGDNECLNGATCIDGVNSYTCICAEGYYGDRCQSEVDYCLNNQCLNGATCIDDLNSYTCLCAEGYYGDKCDSFACNPKEKIVRDVTKATYAHSSSLTIDMVFKPELNDPTSEAYASLYASTIGRVELVFACLTDVTSSIYSGINNAKFSPGSVIASYTLNLAEPVDPSLLEAALNDSLAVFGSLPVTVNEVGQAVMLPPTDEDEVRLDIILGTIGSLIVVAIIVIMVVFALKKYKKLPLLTRKDSAPFAPFGPGSSLGSDNVFRRRHWQNIPSMGQHYPPELASQTMDVKEPYLLPRPTVGNRNLAQKFANPLPPEWESASGELRTDFQRKNMATTAAYPNFLYADTTLSGRSRSDDFMWFSAGN